MRLRGAGTLLSLSIPGICTVKGLSDGCIQRMGSKSNLKMALLQFAASFSLVQAMNFRFS